MSKVLDGNFTQPFYEADDGAGGGGGTDPNVDSNQNTDPKPFDPSTLDPEVQRYIDQQRTNASKSAAKNARDKLMKDKSFRDSIAEDVKKQQEKTVEELIQERELEIQQKADEIAVRENKLTTVRSLLDHSITGDDADALASILTSADPELTAKNVDTFTKLFDQALKSSTEKAKQDLLQNGHVVVTNGGKGAATWTEKYAEAKKAGNTMAQVRIKREALKDGVQL